MYSSAVVGVSVTLPSLELDVLLKTPATLMLKSMRFGSCAESRQAKPSMVVMTSPAVLIAFLSKHGTDMSGRLRLRSGQAIPANHDLFMQSTNGCCFRKVNPGEPLSLARPLERRGVR